MVRRHARGARMKRDRSVYIVELPTGFWIKVTDDEEKAKAAYEYWKPLGAILLRVAVPAAQDNVSTH